MDSQLPELILEVNMFDVCHIIMEFVNFIFQCHP